MPVAVLLFLSDDGQVSVGEIPSDSVPAENLQPVESFEEGVQIADELLLGSEDRPDAEQMAFDETIGGM